MIGARSSDDLFREQLGTGIAAQGVAGSFFRCGDAGVPVNGRRRKENKLRRASKRGAGIQNFLQEGQIGRLFPSRFFLGCQWDGAPGKVEKDVEICKRPGFGEKRQLLEAVSGRSREAHHCRVKVAHPGRNEGCQASPASSYRNALGGHWSELSAREIGINNHFGSLTKPQPRHVPRRIEQQEQLPDGLNDTGNSRSQLLRHGSIRTKRVAIGKRGYHQRNYVCQSIKGAQAPKGGNDHCIDSFRRIGNGVIGDHHDFAIGRLLCLI